jgi:hypothetical protein
MAKKDEETKNLPVSIEDQIKKELQAQQKQVGALPANKIATKGKVFTMPDGQEGPGPLDVIIIDFAWLMAHYPGVYNSANPQQPNCFAVGRENPEGGSLKPHESVEKPQGTDCKVCPKNEWGSAQTGRGKACKNQRRLLVMPTNSDEETEPMTLYVSPGALKNFDAYITRLKNEHGCLPAQVVTEISFDPHQSYPSLMFKFVEKHDNLNLFWSKREQSTELLFRPLEIKEQEAA